MIPKLMQWSIEAVEAAPVASDSRGWLAETKGELALYAPDVLGTVEERDAEKGYFDDERGRRIVAQVSLTCIGGACALFRSTSRWTDLRRARCSLLTLRST